MADTFDFWQDHSERFLVMAYLHERNKELANPDGVASKTGDCGDTITIYLKIAEDTIKDFSYQLQGCLNTNACCNALAEMVVNQPLDKCWQITHEDLIKDLQTLPQDHFHCAELAVGTFYLALSQAGKHSS